MFSVYKPNQGSAVRWCTAVGAALLGFGLCKFTYDQLAVFRTSRNADVAETIQLVVPAVLAAVLAYLIFWFVGRYQRTVDFMIATEGEMKKVNWSTRKEVFGATRVVIFFVLALGVLLFAVDLVFMFLFESIGVLKTDTFGQLFGLTGG